MGFHHRPRSESVERNNPAVWRRMTATESEKSCIIEARPEAPCASGDRLIAAHARGADARHGDARGHACEGVGDAPIEGGRRVHRRRCRRRRRFRPSRPGNRARSVTPPIGPPPCPPIAPAPPGSPGSPSPPGPPLPAIAFTALKVTFAPRTMSAMLEPPGLPPAPPSRRIHPSRPFHPTDRRATRLLRVRAHSEASLRRRRRLAR